MSNKVIISIYLGFIVYLIGVLLIHPKSPLCKFLDKKYDYDKILITGNYISIICFIFTTIISFFILP